MRDLWIHDDDLIVATHGRSFWILDDIAPLREASAAIANSAHLFKPAPAYRVQRDTNTDTPLPPDEPAAPNPPDGAILDYYLPAAASSGHARNSGCAGPSRPPLLQHRQARHDRGRIAEAVDPAVLGPHASATFHRPPECTAGSGICTIRHPQRRATTIRSPRFRTTLRVCRWGRPFCLAPTLCGSLSTENLPPRHSSSRWIRASRLRCRGLEKKFQTEMRLASIMTESTQALLQGGSIRAQLEKLNAQANSPAKMRSPHSRRNSPDSLGAPADSSLRLRRKSRSAASTERPARCTSKSGRPMPNQLPRKWKRWRQRNMTAPTF